jgi:hypothetical protein
MFLVPASLDKQTLATVPSLGEKRLMRCGGASLAIFNNKRTDGGDFFSVLLLHCVLSVHKPAEIEFYSFLFPFPIDFNEVF